MWILTAFLFGFLGSFHCAGMCGPIALAVQKSRNEKPVRGKLFYNFGRIITYSILGILMGVFGRSLSFVGFQKTISIISGVAIVLIAGVPLINSHFKPFNSLFYNLTSRLKKVLQKLFKSRSDFSMLGIGIANGILPCGFVYLALGASLAMNSIFGSMAYMALFGLGTVPMMLFIGLGGQIVNFKFQSTIRRAIPYFALLMGVWLIFKGVNFEIHSCCHH